MITINLKIIHFYIVEYCMAGKFHRTKLLQIIPAYHKFCESADLISYMQSQISVSFKLATDEPVFDVHAV